MIMDLNAKWSIQGFYFVNLLNMCCCFIIKDTLKAYFC